jgi:hypothetical protein
VRLQALALDNASEGCLRETFGALIGHHQAAYAADPGVAAAMRMVAEDETWHAALAHQIDAWVMPLMAADARPRVEVARSAAMAALRGELAAAVDAKLQTRAGVPSASVAQRLFAAPSASCGQRPPDDPAALRAPVELDAARPLREHRSRETVKPVTPPGASAELHTGQLDYGLRLRPRLRQPWSAHCRRQRPNALPRPARSSDITSFAARRRAPRRLARADNGLARVRPPAFRAQRSLSCVVASG